MALIELTIEQIPFFFGGGLVFLGSFIFLVSYYRFRRGYICIAPWPSIKAVCGTKEENPKEFYFAWYLILILSAFLIIFGILVILFLPGVYEEWGVILGPPL
ncbi:MAG: hypothetical protein ABIE23_03315 [archaeon]